MSRRGPATTRGRRSGTGPKPARPNLPHHNLPAPFSQLQGLGYGDFPEVYDEVADQLTRSNRDAAARQLLNMVQDESYYDYDGDEYAGGQSGDARGWTRLHALRLLGRMGDAGRIGIEPLLPLLNSEDDYLREDAPFYYAAMGVAAIPPLARVLGDRKADTYQRAGAGESLAEIAEGDPAVHKEVVTLIEAALANEQDDDALNGFLIINLCDLAARDSMPIIEQAYLENRVDETIVGLAEVQEHLGFAVTAERARWEYGPGEPRRVRAETDSRPKPVADESIQMPYIGGDKVGRNDPCPCGSGKKYKKCCGAA